MAKRERSEAPAPPEGATPDWMKSILSGTTPGADAPPPSGAGRESKPYLTYEPEREGLLPTSNPNRQQAPHTHAGGDWTAAKTAASPGDMPSEALPQNITRQNNDAFEQSWMNKDPVTWWPRPEERQRWKKQLTNEELVQWNKLVSEQSYWHMATRNGQQPANTYGSPQFRDFMKRKSEFMNRTVPRWRQHEQRNPPRRYRPRMSAVEALGGNELDVG